MTGYELHDLLANARELISDTWNFFLTVHLAVLGIVFIASRGIGFVERTVLVGAYLAFMYMNYAAQLDNYGQYVQIIEQIELLPATAEGAATAKALATMEPVWITEWLMHAYIAAAAVASLIIMLIRGDRAAN